MLRSARFVLMTSQFLLQIWKGKRKCGVSFILANLTSARSIMDPFGRGGGQVGEGWGEKLGENGNRLHAEQPVATEC